MRPTVDIDAVIAEQRLRVGGPHPFENRIVAEHDARGAIDDHAGRSAWPCAFSTPLSMHIDTREPASMSAACRPRAMP
jgi:hypothetical protein